jgi:SAM-dependent methyltransferase
LNSAFGADERLQAIAAWWASNEGQAVWQDECVAVEPWLARCFGYHALHLSLLPLNPTQFVAHDDSSPMPGLRIPHAFRLGPLGAEVRARFESLPLAAESVDLVVVQHVLEFASDPHPLLRELDRVLMPEGHVVLMSFNPWSFWGVHRWLNPQAKAPWFGQAIGRQRVHDWLALLGYDVQAEAWGAHACLVQKYPRIGGFLRHWLARLLPRSGSVYMLWARKRVSMPAPIRHRWRLIPSLGVAAPNGSLGQARGRVQSEQATSAASATKVSTSANLGHFKQE